jgi:hypothetical protein
MTMLKRARRGLTCVMVCLSLFAGVGLSAPAAAVDVPLLVFQGAWAKDCLYQPGAIVTYNGASYVS